jgi:hypothetical protein
MAFTKKEWFRPELIVLARNKPEEAVLNGCKFDSAQGPGLEGGGRLHCKHGLFGEPGSPCESTDFS